MDPLSISASIITFLQATGLLLSLCYDIRSALRKAPWALTKVTEETRDLRNIVEALQLAVDDCEDSSHDGSQARSQALQAMYDSIHAPLETCASEISSLTDKIKKCALEDMADSKGKAILSALKWRLTEQEAKESLERLDRCKNSLNLALSSRNLAALINIEKITISINRHTAKVCSRLESLMEMLSVSNFNEERREAISWLSPLRPWENHDAVLSSHQAGTNDWLFKTSEFENWFKGENRMFWLSGPPGAGKSVLLYDRPGFTSSTAAVILTPENSAQVVEYASADSTALHGVAYCDFRSPESQSLTNILGSLLGQLCTQLGTFPDGLLETYQRYSKPATYSAPKPALLQQWLLDISKQRKVHLFVDAIDDIEQGYQLSETLSHLVSRSTQLSVFLVSRNDVRFEISLQDASRVSLGDHVAEIDSDIQRYALHRLQSESELEWLPPAILEMIFQSLCSKSLGVFRWAQCQLDSIAQARTLREVKAKISTLPDGLDETYSRILSQVPAAYLDVFLKALNWIAFSVKPLTLEQLWEAVAIERNTAFIDEDSRLRGPHDVLVLGKSLISVTPEGHVRLAHLSVRDYLMSAKIRENPAVSQFALERREVATHLAIDCLTYLFFEELKDGPSRTADEYMERLKKLPLLKYVATAWPYHVRAAAAGGGVEHLVSRFFHPDHHNNFMSWVQVVNADANFKWNVYPPHATPLYYASSFGLVEAVQFLLSSKHSCRDLDNPGSRFGGTPLHAAAIRRHLEVMTLLMDQGANPGKGDFNKVTPLHSAAAQGAADVVELLLQYGAPTDVKDGMDHKTPLEWARLGERLEIFALLEAHESHLSPPSDSSNGMNTPSTGRSGSNKSLQREEVVVWAPGLDFFPDYYEKRSGLNCSILLQFELDGDITKLDPPIVADLSQHKAGKVPAAW